MGKNWPYPPTASGSYTRKTVGGWAGGWTDRQAVGQPDKIHMDFKITLLNNVIIVLGLHISQVLSI